MIVEPTASYWQHATQLPIHTVNYRFDQNCSTVYWHCHCVSALWDHKRYANIDGRLIFLTLDGDQWVPECATDRWQKQNRKI